MNKERLHHEIFGGKRNLGFRVEAGSGTAQLQIQASDNAFYDKPGGLYNVTDAAKLDVLEGQNYRWVMTGDAKVFHEY